MTSYNIEGTLWHTYCKCHQVILNGKCIFSQILYFIKSIPVQNEGKDQCIAASAPRTSRANVPPLRLRNSAGEPCSTSRPSFITSSMSLSVIVSIRCAITRSVRLRHASACTSSQKVQSRPPGGTDTVHRSTLCASSSRFSEHLRTLVSAGCPLTCWSHPHRPGSPF